MADCGLERGQPEDIKQSAPVQQELTGCVEGGIV